MGGIIFEGIVFVAVWQLVDVRWGLVAALLVLVFRLALRVLRVERENLELQRRVAEEHLSFESDAPSHEPRTARMPAEETPAPAEATLEAVARRYREDAEREPASGTRRRDAPMPSAAVAEGSGGDD